MALKKIYPYVKQHRAKIAWGFLFVTISNILATIVPKFVGKAIDIISSGRFDISLVLWQIFWILALTAASGIFMYLTRQMIIVVSRQIEFQLRRDFIAKLSRLPFSFFTENSSGQLISLATNDISAAREFLGPAVMYTANTISTFLFALFFMLSLDVPMTLLSILPLPLITLTTYRIGKKIHLNFKSVQEEFSKLTTQAQDTFSAIRLVKAFVRESYEQTRFASLSETYKRKYMRLEFYQSLMIPLLIVLIGISQLIVLGYGGLQVINKVMTLGEVTQFFVYINLLIWPVAAIGWVTNLIQRASASIDRIWTVFEIPDNGFSRQIAKSENISAEIVFADVWFRYKDDLPWVVQSLNLEIPAGSAVGIVGTVGSGKSTLVKLLGKIYLPSRGQISIGGISLNEIPDAELRRIMAIVPQEPFLFSDTIAENVRLGKPDATDEEVLHSLILAGMESDLKAFPNGIQTIVGERGITLSGGQKQRVALARAFIARPKILVLDDPFASVDSATEHLILQNLMTEFASTTKIIISTRISAVKDCRWIVFLENGKIEEQGTHEALLKANKKYAQLYEIQRITEEIESSR
ncbi:ABC transporter ATP-binding protein [Bacteroidetes/Chlorobi group bacterium MS-B_bin-24]|nr:MAG: ABC transporter ATP-binding protein [Bacteroidetes/Chlorobi group bacterium MS-B_bin-24]